jgi:hypothetical protein
MTWKAGGGITWLGKLGEELHDLESWGRNYMTWKAGGGITWLGKLGEELHDLESYDT